MIKNIYLYQFKNYNYNLVIHYYLYFVIKFIKQDFKITFILMICYFNS